MCAEWLDASCLAGVPAVSLFCTPPLAGPPSPPPPAGLQPPSASASLRRIIPQPDRASPPAGPRTHHHRTQRPSARTYPALSPPNVLTTTHRRVRNHIQPHHQTGKEGQPPQPGKRRQQRHVSDDITTSSSTKGLFSSKTTKKVSEIACHAWGPVTVVDGGRKGRTRQGHLVLLPRSFSSRVAGSSGCVVGTSQA
jgi:hypothetical protein